MDFKFSKDSGDFQPENAPSEKKSQTSSLVLLLILLGGFGYLYFFTGLIRPQEAQKAPETPAPAQQVTKLPLPPRVSEPAKPAANAPVQATAPKPATPATIAATPAPVAKAVVAPAPAPPATAPKAVVPPAKPQTETKKKELPPAADKKPLPPSVAGKKSDGVAAAPKPAEKKPVVADKKKAPGKNVQKAVLPAKSAKKPAVATAKKTADGPWTIVVGNYILEEALAADMGRVRKAGFVPAIKASTKVKSSMNRLLVSEVSSRAAANETLEKLRRHTSDAFVIGTGSNYAVYAGSYVQDESARSEKARLTAAGFSVSIKHVAIAIPSQSLTIGPFSSKKAADTAILKLKNAGIKAATARK